MSRIKKIFPKQSLGHLTTKLSIERVVPVKIY
jgi:hypothetical protein